MFYTWSHPPMPLQKLLMLCYVLVPVHASMHCNGSFSKKIMGQFFCIKFSWLKMCACKKWQIWGMIRAKPVNQAEERGIGAKIIFWLYSCRWLKFQGALSQTVIPINVQRLPPKKNLKKHLCQTVIVWDFAHLWNFFYICATPQTITVVGIILKEKNAFVFGHFNKF